MADLGHLEARLDISYRLKPSKGFLVARACSTLPVVPAHSWLVRLCLCIATARARRPVQACAGASSASYRRLPCKYQATLATRQCWCADVGDNNYHLGRVGQLVGGTKHRTIVVKTLSLLIDRAHELASTAY